MYMYICAINSFCFVFVRFVLVHHDEYDHVQGGIHRDDRVPCGENPEQLCSADHTKLISG